jgi:hypothetical protein
MGKPDIRAKFGYRTQVCILGLGRCLEKMVELSQEVMDPILG